MFVFGLFQYMQKVIDSEEIHVIYGTKPIIIAVRDISSDMRRFTVSVILLVSLQLVRVIQLYVAV